MTGEGAVMDRSLTKLGVEGKSSIALLRQTRNLMGVRSWGQKAFNHGKAGTSGASCKQNKSHYSSMAIVS